MKFTTPLTRNHEFKRLYSKGKNAASQYAVVYCRRNGMLVNRLGITVSTKVGGAVVRNRVRRRFKEIYRLFECQLSEGHDIVLVARVKSRYSSYAELDDAIQSLFRKLNLTRSDVQGKL